MEGWGAAHKSRASTTAAAPTAFDAAALQRARDAGRWLVAIRGAVYDVTAFLDEHPGGRDAIENEGADATAAWEAIGHSRAARRKMRSMRVGTFVGGNGYSVETGEAPDEAHAAAEDHFGSDVPPSSEDLPFPGPPPSPHGGGQYGVLLAHTMSTHTLAQAWAEQYGRLVSFRVGDKAFLQVSDPDVAAQIWTANPPKEVSSSHNVLRKPLTPRAAPAGRSWPHRQARGRNFAGGRPCDSLWHGCAHDRPR